MAYSSDRWYWYDYPDHLRSDPERATPPVYGRTRNGDYEYQPLSTQELRDACGLGSNDAYDNRLERLQVTAVEQVEATLHYPPAPVERSDGYRALTELMKLSAPASRADEHVPTVYYRETDGGTETQLAAASVTLAGPRLVAIAETVDVWSNFVRIAYQTDVSEAANSIREAVYEWVGARYRRTAGEDVTMPDLADLLDPWIINRVGAG